MRKSTSSTRLIRAGLTVGATTAILLAATATAASAATLPMTLSQTTGPSGGLNTITGTVTPTTASPAPFTTAVTPWVQFQTKGTATACNPTWIAPTAIVVTSATPPVQTVGILAVPAGNVKKLSTTKLAITVPATVVLTANAASATPTSVPYNICVYSGNTPGAAGVGSPLIANAAYSIAGRPTITGVSPLSGPALGGTPITVTGTGFATAAGATTATVGGLPLTGIVVAAGGASFTALTPAHAADDDLTISVTSTGGRVNSDDPDNLNNGGTSFLFDFSNGLEISPNTSPAESTVDLDVLGVGFFNMTFTPAAVSTAASAHIYLVDGVYDPTDANTDGDKDVPPIAECENVLVISDIEAICTLTLANSLDTAGAAAVGTAVPNGAYTVSVVNNGEAEVIDVSETNYDASYQHSEITSTATFTVAPY